MSELKKEYIDGVEVARLEDYGYKDHSGLEKVWKIISTILVYFIIFGIYFSILIIAILSFNSSKIISSFDEFTFKWYFEMFATRSLSNAIGNTFIISITSTVLSTVVGTLVAVGIHYASKKFKQKIMLFNNIPLLNADIVTGTSIMLIFMIIMMIPGMEYLFGFPTMLIAHMYFCIPYVILNVLPKLKDMDPNLMDAALDLGLKPRKALVRVLIPAIKNGIFAGMIFAFTMSFDDFVVSYYTAGNGFNNLSIWIYSSLGRKSLNPSVYAFSTVITFGAMLVLLIINGVTNKKNVVNHCH